MSIRSIFRTLRDLRFRYEPLISIDIYRNRILHNLREFQKAHPSAAVAPVLKSNAYGHGRVQVAKILDGESLPFFCVDTYPEALVLRNERIRTPIVIIGYTPIANIERCHLKDVAFGIMSLEELRRLDAVMRKRNRLQDRMRGVSVHLKIDTGMHRQGIMMDELEQALAIIKEHEAIELQGAYSHFADADRPRSPLTEKQIIIWNQAVKKIREQVPRVRYLHLSNTAGSVHASKIDANVMRIGAGLYGFPMSPDVHLNLQPALAMKTRITSLRTIHADDIVGYNATFKADRTMTIATIPVGYAEGMDRRLSNVGNVLVGKVPCAILGRVNMNITSIDVSNVPKVKLDDEVIAISAERNDPNSIESMATMCKTNPLELLVHLLSSTKRTII